MRATVELADRKSRFDRTDISSASLRESLSRVLARAFISLMGKAGRKPRATDQSTENYFQHIIGAFLLGSDCALRIADLQKLFAALECSRLMTPALQGFAFEGAAMSLGILDFLAPRKINRLQYFIEANRHRHVYMTHIGLGWAVARLRRSVDNVLRKADPLLGPLILDGYGFHHGFFYPNRYVVEKEQPSWSPEHQKPFDQGLGRSLWFYHRGDARSIASTMALFPQLRRSDLWSGIGLACAYSGGVDDEEITLLCDLGYGFRSELAQGAAFAAKARERAGIPTLHTERACRILCGKSSTEAAAITDQCLEGLPAANSSYEIWRKKIRRRFT